MVALTGRQHQSAAAIFRIPLMMWVMWVTICFDIIGIQFNLVLAFPKIKQWSGELGSQFPFPLPVTFLLLTAAHPFYRYKYVSQKPTHLDVAK